MSSGPSRLAAIVRRLPVTQQKLNSCWQSQKPRESDERYFPVQSDTAQTHRLQLCKACLMQSVLFVINISMVTAIGYGLTSTVVIKSPHASAIARLSATTAPMKTLRLIAPRTSRNELGKTSPFLSLPL